jgi:transketolase
MRARADEPDLDWSHTDRRAVDLIRVLAAPDRPADGPGFAGAERTARGGYVLAQADGGTPDVILIATGSEVQIELAAHAAPGGSGVAARVVSMLGWREYVGDAGASVGLEHFGVSADYKTLYAEFGITAERAAQAAHASLARVTTAESTQVTTAHKGRSD